AESFRLLQGSAASAVDCGAGMVRRDCTLLNPAHRRTNHQIGPVGLSGKVKEVGHVCRLFGLTATGFALAGEYRSRLVASANHADGRTCRGTITQMARIGRPIWRHRAVFQSIVILDAL